MIPNQSNLSVRSTIKIYELEIPRGSSEFETQIELWTRTQTVCCPILFKWCTIYDKIFAGQKFRQPQLPLYCRNHTFGGIKFRQCGRGRYILNDTGQKIRAIKISPIRTDQSTLSPRFCVIASGLRLLYWTYGDGDRGKYVWQKSLVAGSRLIPGTLNTVGC